LDYRCKNGHIELAGAPDFAPALMFECGQCFRFDRTERGSYLGVAFGRPLEVTQAGEMVALSCSEDDFLNIWWNFFDLDLDYGKIRRSLPLDPYTAAAAERCAGIRILRQDFWEALCSFVISQCNNIPRIKSIIARLCESFGEPIEYCGRTLYTFPAAERLAILEPEDLSCLRCGYRAAYLIHAARACARGALDPAALARMPIDEAREALQSVPGIGKKVADCVLLFGLHRLEAFPVDTWMKKALAAHYPPGFDPAVFGGYAGLMQQYIFHYARCHAL